MGIALVVPGLLLLPMLPYGGVAPVAIAALVALLLGTSSALAEWRAEREMDPVWRAASEGASAAAGLLIVAAGAAALPPLLGSVGWLLALTVWVLALVLTRLRWSAAVPGAAVLVLATALAARAVWTGPAPTTLLAPRWEAWGSWLGPAVLAGLLWSGCGAGEWTLGPVRRPGETRAPWAGVGAGLLLSTAWVVLVGARFEASPALQLTGPADGALVFLAATAGAVTLLARRPAAGAERLKAPKARAVVGAGTTLWLAGPAAGAVPFGLRSLLPVAVMTLCLLAARRTAGAARATLAIAAGAAGIAALTDWQGLPGVAGTAAALAATGTVAFWVIATRAVLAGRTA